MKEKTKIKITETMIHMANIFAYLLLAGMILGASGFIVIAVKFFWFGLTL